MADVDRIAEVERFGERGDVGRVGVHVVAARGLAGAAVAPPVVGDDPETLSHEVQHLVVPVVAAQRPAVVEHDRLPGAPVLVEDLRAVFRLDAVHGLTPIYDACTG
jgi:hypothetical protein